jgi:fumarate reductase flavoprotein subunit
MQDARCIGVEVANEEGTRRHAADAVVIADGGFSGNPEMLRRFITPHPERLRLRGPAAGRGDGIRIAEAAGAQLIGMPYFYGHVLSADALMREDLCPFPHLDFLAEAGLMVDGRGERFADEGKGRVKGGVYMANAIARTDAGTPNVIFDHAMWESAGREFFCPPNPNLVEAGGALHRAPDLLALERTCGLPEGSLRRTVGDYNRAVESGGLDACSPKRSVRRPVRKIEVAPFYAAPACAAITHTMGGIKVDDRARVLDQHDHPIKGLYAAGSSCGGLEGGPAGGYLGGLIKAVVFGLLAAEAVAAGM